MACQEEEKKASCHRKEKKAPRCEETPLVQPPKVTHHGEGRGEDSPN